MKRVEIDVKKAIEDIISKKLTRNEAAAKLGTNASTLNYKIYHYLNTLSKKEAKRIEKTLEQVRFKNRISRGRHNISYNHTAKKMLEYIEDNKISKREAKDLALKLKIEIPCYKIYEQLKDNGINVV